MLVRALLLLIMVCLFLTTLCLPHISNDSCVPDDSDGRLKYKCDCDSIRLPFHKYAGDFCELKSTELCTFNGRPGTGLNKDAFCVNGGKCNHHVNEHQKYVNHQMPLAVLQLRITRMMKSNHVNNFYANELLGIPVANALLALKVLTARVFRGKELNQKEKGNM